MTCENCGQPAGPRFCGACGQSLEHRRSPLLSLLRELLEEALSLDGRTIRTLRALVHPGRLTRLYLDGKRAPFLAPLRLYLLASVVLFSSAFSLEAPNANEVNVSIGGVAMGEHVRGRPNVSFLEPDSRDGRWMATIYAPNLERLRAKGAQEALEYVFRGMRSVLPISLIAFLPVFALALKLLYVRHHVLYVDHLIFAAHFQAALFLMFATAWLVARMAGLVLVWTILLQFVVFLLMLTVYLGKALRRLHGESRAMTIGKTFLMLFAYMLALQAVFGPAMVFIISRA
jgi:hypothetical protein